jgi:hypothetical protein
MANQVHVFKDRDVNRLIRIAERAGLEITGLEVNLAEKVIRVGTRKPGAGAASSWDEVLDAKDSVGAS